MNEIIVMTRFPQLVLPKGTSACFKHAKILTRCLNLTSRAWNKGKNWVSYIEKNQGNNFPILIEKAKQSKFTDKSASKKVGKSYW